MIQLGKEKAKEFLRARTPFVFNATNITSEMRSKWISLFVEYGARVRLIYLEVPYATLLKQNHNRNYKVPEAVIQKMISKLEIPTPQEAQPQKTFNTSCKHSRNCDIRFFFPNEKDIGC